MITPILMYLQIDIEGGAVAILSETTYDGNCVGDDLKLIFVPKGTLGCIG